MAHVRGVTSANDWAARFLGFSFLVRLAYFLIGVGWAIRLFGRVGLFVVCLTALLSIPLWILAAYRIAKPGER